ncbi:MAG TPA: asparagine synthase-related protein [Terriglobales bacterium]|nr:asparagine synthase-related protein [Terriglobales bacterium]
MLVDGSGFKQGELELHRLETDSHAIYWKGLVYMDGCEAGPASIRRFASSLSDVAKASIALRGTYFVLVRDKLSGDTFAFVDQTGLFHAFASDTTISTSLLELAADEKLAFPDMDPEAVADFLSYGYLTFGRTLFTAIRRIQPEQVACISPRTSVVMRARPVRPLGATPTHTVEEVLRNLATAARGDRVSVDLTGGVDTRIVAVTLDYFGVPFEVAHAGLKGNRDMEIAAELAHVLKRDLVITYHNVEDFDSVLPELFTVCDGLLDVAKDHLGLQMQHDRLARGVSLVVTGDGGTLHKDHYWLHDFPFYAKRCTDVDKLIRYRVAPIEPNYAIFAPFWEKIARTYRARARDFVQNLVAGRNTETFDQVYFHLHTRDNLGRFSTNHVRLLNVHSPLADRDAVTASYHLPRSMRFFNRFHRESLTRLNPAAARVRTSEGGVSASAEWSKITADLSKYAADKLLRMRKKLAQRFLNQPYKQQVPVSGSLHPKMRSCSVMKDAVENLRDRQILNSSVTLENLPNTYLGTVLTLHLTLLQLEGIVGSTHAAGKRA